MFDLEDIKSCTLCGDPKPISQFGTVMCKYTKKDGTVSTYVYPRPQCKPCELKRIRKFDAETEFDHNEYRKNNKSKYRSYAKKHYHKNRKKILDKLKKKRKLKGK